jgi:uncharacterized protein CbrC (UPF0167 family)
MSQPASDFPFFKYHPDPIGSGVLVGRESVCPCCGQIRGFAYEGPSFSRADVDNLCPWCVASGEAAEKFELEFVYDDDLEPVKTFGKKDELQHRTPGYFFATIYEWPVHCDDYCAVLRQVQWPEIAPFSAELAFDLARLQKMHDMSAEQIIDQLHGTALWAYLFRCLHCGKHRLSADYE